MGIYHFSFYRIFYMSNDKYRACIHFIKNILQPAYLKENDTSVSFVSVLCLFGREHLHLHQGLMSLWRKLFLLKREVCH